MTTGTATTTVPHARLKSFIDRIENLEEQKKEIGNDVKDVYNELATEGFVKKAVREVIRRRRKSKAELSELENLVDLYEVNL